MCLAENFKQFVCHNLTAVADEIFAVFHLTIAEYEKELSRQRQLFELAFKPVVKLQRIGLQENCVFNGELVVDKQSSLDQDKTFRVDQKVLELPLIREQQEQKSISEFRLKEEPKDRQIYSADGENTKSGERVMDWNPEVAEVNCEPQQLYLPPAVSQRKSKQEGTPELSKNKVACHSNECELSISGPLSKSNGIQIANKPCVSQEGRKSIGELKLKQEPEALQLCSANETRDTIKIPSVNGNPEEPLHKCEDEKNPVVSAANSDLSLYPGVSPSRKPTALKLENSCFRVHEPQNTYDNFQKRQFDNVHNDTVLMPITSLTDDTHHDEFKNKSKVPEKRDGSFDKTLELLSRGTVLQHKTIHAANRPYICQECGKSFLTNLQLNRHKRTHTDTERRHACITCGKRYLTKGHLKEHEIVHTGERPHACQVCHKSFALKKNLTVHMKIHSSDRPYVCRTCGKGFKQSTHLRHHMMMHIVISQYHDTP